MSKDHKQLAPEGTVLVAKMQGMNPFQWPPAEDGSRVENVQLYPVYTEDPESPNHEWSKATPGGSLQLNVSNPAAQGRIEPGKEYFVFVVEAN
jgi:hypothetical protein